MGNCCASSTTKQPPYSHSPANPNRRTTAPPPSHPLPEEETVKEVLSETPTLAKSTIPIDNGPQKHPSLTPDKEKHQNSGDLKKPSDVVDFNPEDLSEDFSASEICSTLSESVPTPTTTVTDKLDHEGDVSYVRQRSPAKARNRPLLRNSEPSPGRVRSGHGRDSARRSPAKVPRKEIYEKNGRGSVSPALRTENGGAKTSLGQSPSMRKAGKSPGRVRSDMRDKTRKLEERFSNNDNSKELVENTLVSLECFIFL